MFGFQRALRPENHEEIIEYLRYGTGNPLPEPGYTTDGPSDGPLLPYFETFFCLDRRIAGAARTIPAIGGIAIESRNWLDEDARGTVVFPHLSRKDSTAAMLGGFVPESITLQYFPENGHLQAIARTLFAVANGIEIPDGQEAINRMHQSFRGIV